MTTKTERDLRDFVRDAVSNFAVASSNSALGLEDDTRWEQGADGHFRELKRRTRKFWPILNGEWLRLQPDYQTCVECLKSDVVIGVHLGSLVGTSMSARAFEANDILMSLMYAILDDQGPLAFTDERFHSHWVELVGFLGADRLANKIVAPLPNLLVPAFPLQLNNELALDRLTEEEVTRCYEVGVIQPVSRRFPLIYRDVSVGIRKTMYLPKLIYRGDQPPEGPPDPQDEGSFGNRPIFQVDLAIDDVLSALRLFKRTQVRSSGFASWTDSPWLAGSTTFRALAQSRPSGKFELSDAEVPHFVELWRLLEQGAAGFAFSIHRFNLAFDRGLLADRLVDLVIAAEALLLGDLDEKYRGELRFRFALRGAKSIEHPKYSEHDVFRVMRQAYDARSAFVHGGSPNETRLPDDQSAKLPAFIDAIEDLVRLGLRKALSMKEAGKKVRQSEYWDTLVLSKSNMPRP
jgi:hypothetical protein